MTTTQTNRNASEDVKLFSGAQAKENTYLSIMDDFNRCSIDDVAAWYDNGANFPENLPYSWRLTWDHTFSQRYGKEDRDLILKCINDGTIYNYDQSDVWSGNFSQAYLEKDNDISFFYDLTLYPKDLPASWRFSWLYLIERPWCKPICDIIVQAISKNDLQNLDQYEALNDPDGFCNTVRIRWNIIDFIDED